MKSENYFRFSKTEMEGALRDVKGSSGSELLAKIRAAGFRLTLGDITFVLAEAQGFCWGVERTISMAHAARKFFPESKIWLTNEIIHNPVINTSMADMGMQFLQKSSNGMKDFSAVQKGDVVILPAFGATVDEMAMLKERNVQIVDTTCPWVSKVWTSIEKSKEKGHTAIIHGKHSHEETIATRSFAEKYLVVKDLEEAEQVAAYILGQGDAGKFLERFAGAASTGFNPDKDLLRIGVANQTTMLKGETELIAKLLERAMIQRFGPQAIDEHFVASNTICDATQERQDAMYKMLGASYEAPASRLYAELEGAQLGVKLRSAARQRRRPTSEDTQSGGGSGGVDLCLVVGGFNSSNTSHLLEIAEEEGVPAYHVDCALRIGGVDGLQNRIQHKPLGTSASEAVQEQGLQVVEGFLPAGPLVVGVTSGASTPDSVLGECLQRILALRGLA